MGRKDHENSKPSLSVVFWGHACFGVHIDGHPFLLIDPFDPVGLGGVSGPSRIPLSYSFTVSTHEHSDHAAFHTQPNAKVVGVPGTCGPLALDYRTAAHDPLGGRLRGGTVRILEIKAFGIRIVHCSDLGERPTGILLEWLTGEPIDLLIVPAGGYFTLNADGAVELAARANPKLIVFCHTADDGLPLANMQPREIVRRRSGHWPQITTRELELPLPNIQVPTVVEMIRPALETVGTTDG